MSKRFDFIGTALPGLFSIKRNTVEDDRGFLERMYCAEEYKEVGLEKPVVQINHTLTHKKGALRGLHFQYQPYLETKIVSCLKGEVFDVAVDIRKDSPTFLKWHAESRSCWT